MKSWKFMAAAFLTGLFFVGCAFKPTFVEPSWKSAPKSMKIIFTKPEVSALDDLKDDLPEYVDNFSEWFKIQLPLQFKQKSGDRDISYIVSETAGVDSVAVVLNNENFNAPKFAEMGDEAEVYLIMDKIWIGHGSDTRMVSTGVGAGPNAGSNFNMSSTSSLSATCVFSFYDAKTKKNLAYGRASGASPYTFALSTSNWETAVGEMVRKIIDRTPISIW